MARYIFIAIMIGGLVTSSCGFKRKKYDNPIAKDTKQPDKVLYDRAIDDIEHSRYEVARITLNTLINTYDQSEFMAKAKLAVADSWFREGGTQGYAQAEAEYKDFILFYPTMAEAAESQEKICMIHYKQMEKADRDSNQALRAEDECRQLVVQFPNSQFVPEAQQLLRNIQEGLAEGEFLVGDFYYKRGANPSAANRFSRLVDQYPLYSKADEALFELGDSYNRMGTRFRAPAGDAYARIVKDYPLSPYADAAKKKLTELEMPIPQADPVAYARMKWEAENRTKPGLISRANILKRGPDVSSAAKSGQPAMTTLRGTVPVSVPLTRGTPGFTGDVVATPLGSDSSALDKLPDARSNPPAAGAAAGAEGQPAGAKPEDAKPADANAAGAKPADANASAANPQQAAQTTDPKAKKKKKDKKVKPQPATNPPATTTPGTTTPGSTPTTPPANNQPPSSGQSNPAGHP
jgi:outer membrane protein assembly factor BamD